MKILLYTNRRTRYFVWKFPPQRSHFPPQSSKVREGQWPNSWFALCCHESSHMWLKLRWCIRHVTKITSFHLAQPQHTQQDKTGRWTTEDVIRIRILKRKIIVRCILHHPGLPHAGGVTFETIENKSKYDYVFHTSDSRCNANVRSNRAIVIKTI